MVYYDKFGHAVPMGQEEYYFKSFRMDPGSEMSYKVDKVKEDIFKNIREIQEESRPKLFQYNFAESKESNSPIIQPPIIITNLLKRHGID